MPEQITQEILHKAESQHLSKFSSIFGDASPKERNPVYSGKTREIAYYETKLSSGREGDKGYLMLSATDETLPVVEFSSSGNSHYERFLGIVGNQKFRMVRYNSHYIVAESPRGKILAEIGEKSVILPSSLRKHTRGEGGSFDAADQRSPLGSKFASVEKAELIEVPESLSHAEFRNKFQDRTITLSAHKSSRIKKAWSSVNDPPIPGPYKIFKAEGSGNRTYFRQFERQAVGFTIISGCGPTAWMNLFGWHDRNFQSSLLSGTQRYNNDYIEDITWRLYDYLGTFQLFGYGCTLPGDMADGFLFAPRALGHDADHWFRYDFIDTDEPWVFKVARKAIRAKRPFIVGYDEDHHYTVGMMVAEPTGSPNAWKTDSWIYIHEGKWIPIDTVFAIYAAFDFYPIEQAKQSFGSYCSPAITKKSSRAIMAIQGKRRKKINIYSSNDGLGYSNNIRLEKKTPYAPTLALFKDNYYLSWVGGGGEKRLKLMRSSDGVTWGDYKILNWKSDNSPSLTVFDNQLYLVWFSLQGRLNLVRSSDGINWIDHKKLSWHSESSPAAAQFKGDIYIATSSINEWLKILRSTDGQVFTEVVKLNWRSKRGPGLCSHKDRLVLAWKGRGYDRVNLAFSKDGAKWNNHIRLSSGCEDSPEIVSFEGKLIVAVNLKGSEHRILVRKQSV